MAFARQMNGLPYNFHSSHSKQAQGAQPGERRSSSAETATALAA